jgi:hypothetical protein
MTVADVLDLLIGLALAVGCGWAFCWICLVWSLRHRPTV